MNVSVCERNTDYGYLQQGINVTSRITQSTTIFKCTVHNRVSYAQLSQAGNAEGILLHSYTTCTSSLDGDVPHSASYGVYISQFIRFARVSS